jgi:DNA-binding GntR family transcriptional regulator
MAGAVERAYVEIRERIIAGIYAPAARITEQEISEFAGVSRTPAREALRRLQSEGLVRIAPNHGAVVVQWSDDDIDDIFDLRSLLEPYGAKRAARYVTAAGLTELKLLATKQYEESAARKKGYLQRIGDLNSQFHRCLHRNANSERLNASMGPLVEAPLMLRTFARYSDDDLLRSAMHHLEIVSALEARDGEWAGAVMRAHILAAHVAMRPAPHENSGARRRIRTIDRYPA